jgi:hypothetical protein
MNFGMRSNLCWRFSVNTRPDVDHGRADDAAWPTEDDQRLSGGPGTGGGPPMLADA